MGRPGLPNVDWTISGRGNPSRTARKFDFVVSTPVPAKAVSRFFIDSFAQKEPTTERHERGTTVRAMLAHPTDRD